VKLDDRIAAVKTNPASLRIYMDKLPLKRRGNLFSTNCPFHKDDTPSFKISESDGVWLWRCYGRCHESGNVIQFLSRFEHIDIMEALEKAEQFLGNSWESKKKLVESTFQKVGPKAEQFLAYTMKQWENAETNLAKNKAAQEWLLTERGITNKTARELHFGYRQNVGKLSGAEAADIADKGWIATPCIVNGKVASIKYRSIVRKAFCKQGGMAKGDYTPLFNSDNIDPLEPVFVVESEFDAAVMHQAGFTTVSIQSASTPPTAANRDLLMLASCRFLAGDTDDAGREAMEKLWAELGAATFLLRWPDGCKDATDAFNACNRDIKAFKELVNKLCLEARANPSPNIYSLADSLAAGNIGNLADHPLRLRFPWSNVDNMAIVLPGSVMTTFALTGSGKTAWLMNVTVNAARKHDEVVINYSGELSPEEFNTMVAAYLLKKHRNHLTPEDGKRAAELLKNTRYYVGYNSNVTHINDVLDVIEGAIQRYGGTVAVLDHLHFFTPNEVDEIKAQAAAMQRIKNIARKYKVKFIVVGQPRKADQKSKGRMLHLTDAKGSEAFSSTADAAFILHRDTAQVIDPAKPPLDVFEPTTYVKLVKGRSKGDGAALSVLHFHGELASFSEVTNIPESPVETMEEPMQVSL